MLPSGPTSAPKVRRNHGVTSSPVAVNASTLTAGSVSSILGRRSTYTTAP